MHVVKSHIIEGWSSPNMTKINKIFGNVISHPTFGPANFCFTRNNRSMCFINCSLYTHNYVNIEWHCNRVFLCKTWEMLNANNIIVFLCVQHSSTHPFTHKSILFWRLVEQNSAMNGSWAFSSSFDCKYILPGQNVIVS